MKKQDIYLTKVANKNELISKKPANLNHIEYFLLLASLLLFGILEDITSYAVGIKIYALTAWIQKYKSVIKKKRRSMIK